MRKLSGYLAHLAKLVKLEIAYRRSGVPLCSDVLAWHRVMSLASRQASNGQEEDGT